MANRETAIQKVRDALIHASTTYTSEHMVTLRRYLALETNPNACWVLKNIVENAEIAEKKLLPLCDDTGIPQLLLEVGPRKIVSGTLLQDIQRGIEFGLRELPGRPMAVRGDEVERLEQSNGLIEDPGALVPVPIILKPIDENILKLHILMQGGGPEIRGKTFRIFHQQKISVIIDEIVKWATDGASQLGCTPCAPAIGIGRTHNEASALMLEAMAYANYGVQSSIECEITERINTSNIGPMGLRGVTTALATFLKVGPQRASGVRIVCLRLCCIVEPRTASVLL